MGQQTLSPLMHELMQISDMHDDIDEKHRQWHVLWQQHIEGELLPRCDPQEAATITSVGASILHSQERYRDMIVLVNAVYSHPRFAEINTTSTLYSYEIMAQLRLGDEVRAVEVGYRLLGVGQDGVNKWDIYALCLPLLLYVKVHKQHADDDEATEELTRLAVDFIRTVDASLLAHEMPARATYRQLDGLVSSAVTAFLHR